MTLGPYREAAGSPPRNVPSSIEEAICDFSISLARMGGKCPVEICLDIGEYRSYLREMYSYAPGINIDASVLHTPAGEVRISCLLLTSQSRF